MSLIKKLLFSIFVFVLFFVLLELGLGVFYFKGRLLTNQTSSLFRMAANLDEVQNGIRFRTNSLALRDEEIPSKGPGETYILCAGDSSTFGWLLPEEDTYPRKLQNLLNQKDPKIRVINAGTPGYTTFHQRYFLEEKFLALQPDIVILKAGHNERRLVYASHKGTEKSFFQSFISQLRIYNFLMEQRRKHVSAPKPPTVPKVSADDMIDDLKVMNGILKEKNIPLVFIYWGLNRDAVGDKKAAEDAIASKDFDKAIFHISRALHVEVNWDFELYEMLSLCYKQKGDEKRAAEASARAKKWHLRYGTFMDGEDYLKKIRELEKDPNFHLIAIEDEKLTHEFLMDMVHPKPAFNDYLSKTIADYLINNGLLKKK